MGYRITGAEGEAGANLTDPEWRALVYVASQHGFSAPHLRLEDGEEAAELCVEAADAEGLRGALGKALEARDHEEVRTPDGELAYDTIQRVRHVLLSDCAPNPHVREKGRRIGPQDRRQGLIHRSAWKGNSQKVVCRMPHSPARWQPYGRPDTSRLIMVENYMLHMRIKMRLGVWAASS